MDRTAELHAALDRYCSSPGVSQEEATRIKSALALKPIRKPSEFTSYAASVVSGKAAAGRAVLCPAWPA